jgi:hypothetical protein
MKLKTALWISGGVILAGAAYWYFFVETPLKKITQEDRAKLKKIDIQIDDSEDTFSTPTLPQELLYITQ